MQAPHLIRPFERFKRSQEDLKMTQEEAAQIIFTSKQLDLSGFKNSQVREYETAVKTLITKKLAIQSMPPL